MKILLFPLRYTIRLEGGRTVPEVISLYRGDRLPSLEINIVDYNSLTGVETPTNLSAAGIIVRLKSKLSEGGTTLKTNGTFTAVNAASGSFRYDWVATDTDKAGTYTGEISIDYPIAGTSPVQYKSRTIKQFELRILEDLV